MLSHGLIPLCQTIAWTRLRALLFGLILIALAALAACGTLLVSLTDADGDYLSYSVDVVSLSLTTANDRVVQALPTRQRVDFAELVDLTELVTACLDRIAHACAQAAVESLPCRTAYPKPA